MSTVSLNADVSVIMAVHNGEGYICEAVDSILSQTLSRLEFIIVDDASTDATPKVLSTYRDARMRILRNQRRLGPAASRNRAIREAGTPLVAIQDADDISLPARLQIQADFLAENPSIDLVGSHAFGVMDDGRNAGTLAYPPKKDLDIKWALLFWNPFIHTSMMLRRSAVEEAGWYAEKGELAWMAEDYDLLSRINLRRRSANIGLPLVKYRLNPSGASANVENMRRVSEEASKRNISRLVGQGRLDADEIRALRKFWSAGELLSVEDVRRVLAGNKILQQAFLFQYVAARTRRSDRLRFYLDRTRCAFSQARHNRHLDASWRRSLLLSTLAVAIKAVAHLRR